MGKKVRPKEHFISWDNTIHPQCPEPELTMGIAKHNDCDFMTIFLQDQVGGLQVLRDNQWVNVPPVHGALVVNIGDILQTR
ncbi:hypothetical protein TSUD_398060 [Trifolium subterraneum]|uniref:Isopenicillin N synthase-like Fe(2+) 2OG dioxygenase domain-containing protein n=1 Tax=Trifolium subterraneum TaxID=3900 RepID=A0A2Z6NWB6_TRISU|nr:hypothetical protein TSUD_398060 [Trifolium subterraneum]